MISYNDESYDPEVKVQMDGHKPDNIRTYDRQKRTKNI